VNEAQARARVQAMFQVWEDVSAAAINYNRGGFIPDVGAFTDGDVSTAAEYNAVEGACSNGAQSPIVYDVDGTLFEELGQDSSVVGFAGPCSIDGNGLFLAGQAVMNGIYLDGIDDLDNPEVDDPALFDAAFVHEFGHFSGLDHSQINVECAVGCGADDLAGLPTMFPFLVDESQRTLSIDDVAWISRLHPTNGAATHGTITGTVYFSDGESHLQYANVIARRVGDERRFAVSTVSGYRFRTCTPNTITNPGVELCPSSGSLDPAHIGLYEIPVPPGSYTIEVESIDPSFIDGSSVGPSEFPIAMPGTAPAPLGPIAIAAGQTSSGNDIVLIGTQARFDQFEGS
jgi:hypothetical protein